MHSAGVVELWKERWWVCPVPVLSRCRHREIIDAVAIEIEGAPAIPEREKKVRVLVRRKSSAGRFVWQAHMDHPMRANSAAPATVGAEKRCGNAIALEEDAVSDDFPAVLLPI